MVMEMEISMEIRRQHDIIGNKKYLTFYKWNTCFLLNIPWKFCGNLKHFYGDTKENVSGCQNRSLNCRRGRRTDDNSCQ